MDSSSGLQPAEVAHDCKELRASAAPRLRPAQSYGPSLPAGISSTTGCCCPVA